MGKKRYVLGIFALFGCLSVFAIVATAAPKQVDIIFTHDLHSHLNEFQVEENNKVITVGGAARIETFIDTKKKENENVLVVDAGDFSMGTLYQTIYETQASELRMLGAVGTEVTTLGNHEFDYRTEGLVNMLSTAESSGDPLPALVLCNIDRTSQTEEQQKLCTALDAYGVKDYVIVQKGDIRIAVIGVFGKDSLACAPTCILDFEDPISAVKRTVQTIQETEDADMVVCVSHGGTGSIASKSEDEILAKKVPGLDLIVSGHSHTLLQEPIIYGDTVIVSSGEYGEYIGNISMQQKENGRWSLLSYEPVLMDETISEDEEIKDTLAELTDKINAQYLQLFDYEQDQVLTDNRISFEKVEEVYNRNDETRIGNLLSDSYIYTVEHANDYDGIPVDCAVVPSGIIRDTFCPGKITVSDVFNVFSLGIGKDQIPGYPLISVYLTGEELRTAAEVDASVSPLMSGTRLYCSGLGFSFEQNRMILNKTTDVWLIDRQGNREELEDNKLYRVVTDLYSGQMLGTVTDVSKGILKLVPKDKNGNPISNFEDCILYENGQEIKNWIAVARYMTYMQDTQGGVAASYESTYGRKNAGDSNNIAVLLKHPNKIAIVIYTVLLIVVLLAVMLIIKIHRRIQRKRGNKRK